MATPDEQLEHLRRELDRLRQEHPDVYGILRLGTNALRSCSKWRWEQHGWTLTDGDACGIMNGNPRERQAALLTVLKEQMIRKIEILPEADALVVVPEA